MIAASHNPLLGGAPDDVALIDGLGASTTYGELTERIGVRQREFANLQGHLVFLGASLDRSTVIDYLALTGQGTCVALLDPSTPANVLSSWLHAYRPASVWGFSEIPPSSDRVEPLAPMTERVLLTTSGSTGNPKFVRLSGRNILANAAQIVEALNLHQGERALAHLPFFYSFGLSILNSHLAAGASVTICRASAVEPAFAQLIRSTQTTSVSGVPFNFDIFRRVGLFDQPLPSLRHVTQAGGRLRPEVATTLGQRLSAKGIDLWLMYGQTEATARIAVLPPVEIFEAPDAVGYAVPDSKLTIDGTGLDGSGELRFEGPNVMLGYATSLRDLDGSDAHGGVLDTGDTGRFDDAGRILITGRSKRIAKVAGVRVNLDDVERQLDSLAPVAAIDAGSGIRIVVVGRADVTKRGLERQLRLAPGSIDLVTVDALPCTANGKPDYAALREL